MSELPESTERFFVLEKLSAARKAISKGCGELLTNRRNVDKYMEGNRSRAQECYLELQRTQKRILAALRDAQLALLETDDDKLASTAGRLYEGLSGFNLMSRAYQPVCDVLNSFAQKLPETQDTVNAQVIGRLMNAKSDLDRGEKRPLLPLSIGQIGLVGGSGMINGLIECDTPHIIKGRIIKVKHVEREEKYSNRGIHTGAEVKEVISNKMVFNVLTPKGFKALT